MNWRHQRVFNKGILNAEAIGIGKGVDGSGRNGQNVRMHSGSVRQRGGKAVLVDFSAIAGLVAIHRLWECNLEGQDGGGNWVWWNAYVFSSGTNLYYYDQGDGTTVVITNTLSNTDIWCVNIFDNQFVSNGEDALHIHAGTPGTWMPVGLAIPALAPTNVNAVGVLTGYKKYKYTYTRPTTVAGQPYHIESNPSPELTVQFVAGQQTVITMIPSAEAHAQNYRLYATPLYALPGTPESTFYLISDTIIAAGNTFVDNVGTATTTEEDTADKGVPPVCAQMMWHDNRLYLIGNPANKSLIYYSEIGRPFYFPDENWEEVSRDDGDELTGLASIGPTRYLFKTRSFYEWTGDPTLVTPIRSPFSYQTQNMNVVGIGCRDSLSIAQTLDFVVFRAADRHVYMLTRQELIKLSETAETDVEAMGWDSTGAIYDDYYILHKHPDTLVWHLPTRTYMGKDTGLGSMGKFLVDHNGDLVYGHEDRIMQMYVGTQDEGVDFVKKYRTKFYRVAEDEEEASFRRIRATTSERNCDFTIRTYNENGLQDTGVNALADRHYSHPRGVRGQYLSAEIEWTDTAIIESIGLGFLKRGRRH